MNLNITKELLQKLDRYKINIEHYFILSSYYNREFELLIEYQNFNNTNNCLLFQTLTRLNYLKLDNTEDESTFSLTEKGLELIKELKVE